MEMSELWPMMWKNGENLGKSGNVLPGMPDEVKEDFLSGDWMFGRGTADMKGGLFCWTGVIGLVWENGG